MQSCVKRICLAAILGLLISAAGSAVAQPREMQNVTGDLSNNPLQITLSSQWIEANGAKRLKLVARIENRGTTPIQLAWTYILYLDYRITVLDASGNIVPKTLMGAHYANEEKSQIMLPDGRAVAPMSFSEFGVTLNQYGSKEDDGFLDHLYDLPPGNYSVVVTRPLVTATSEASLVSNRVHFQIPE
jgi:hypothetical protein